MSEQVCESETPMQVESQSDVADAAMFGRVGKQDPRVALAISLLVALPQSSTPDRSPAAPSSKALRSNTSYPEQVTVPTGKPSPVEMHFRVGRGPAHQLAHPQPRLPHPHHLLDPRSIRRAPRSAAYPAGSDITLAPRSQTKLNVYTGEFTIQARIVATRGNHLVEAKLHFQACDRNACMPPKTITVPIDVIGK